MCEVDDEVCTDRAKGRAVLEEGMKAQQRAGAGWIAASDSATAGCSSEALKAPIPFSMRVTSPTSQPPCLS